VRSQRAESAVADSVRASEDYRRIFERRRDEAVTVALRERLEARRRQQRPGALLQAVAALQAFPREQPDRDARPGDAILGYDAFGLPG
jgi:hypothetical protein